MALLKNVPVGKTFEVWGKKFTVLKQDEDKVFVLAAELATMMQFREEGKEYKVAPNDFRDSSVKEFLNGEYIDELVAAGADRNKDILPQVYSGTARVRHGHRSGRSAYVGAVRRVL